MKKKKKRKQDWGKFFFGKTEKTFEKEMQKGESKEEV